MNVNCFTVPFIIIIIISSITTVKDQKQLQNVEYFKYLGSMLTNEGRCTSEIKCRIAMAKAAFNTKRALFIGTLDSKIEEKTSKMLHLEHSFIWC